MWTLLNVEVVIDDTLKKPIPTSAKEDISLQLQQRTKASTKEAALAAYNLVVRNTRSSTATAGATRGFSLQWHLSQQQK